MRILIFDLQFTKYIYFSTIYPSTAGMLISGYHKAKKDTVIFTDTEPQFALYDKVYIIKDEPNLFYLPEWLTYSNVVLVGRHWDGLDNYWNEEWETYPPDITLYHNWIENWLNKYPKYGAKRLDHFYYKPVLLKQKNKITDPEGDKILIIDYDIKSFDKDYSILKNLNISNLKFLHPLVINGATEQLFSFLKQKNVVRTGLWTELKMPEDDEELHEIINLWNKYKLGRMVRIKLFLNQRNEKDWEEVLPQVFYILKEFREHCKKRIYIEPLYMNTFSHPRILQELKRWTGKDMGYAKNSLFDYIVFDSCRNENLIIMFLTNPYEYIRQKKLNGHKLLELINFIEDKPELAELIFEPVNGSAL